MKFTENWYYVYQPSGTGIGNKVIGTEAEIKAMTEEAHKHGIRVIADAVINTSLRIGTPFRGSGRIPAVSTPVPKVAVVTTAPQSTTTTAGRSRTAIC